MTIVELKRRSLDIARERAADAGLTNVRFFEGDIEAYGIRQASNPRGSSVGLLAWLRMRIDRLRGG